MTTIWSATSIASSWSCVTRTVVTCTSSCRRRSQLAQLLAHARVERAERLVEQQHLGSTASARASAMRCRWPPESCDG